MNRETLAQHSAPVPRYTSYPTAPHFHSGIDAQSYGSWLAAVDPAAVLSLYLHVPFCDRLCWFCGCHTKQVRRYEPIAAYVKALHAEIELVASHLGERRKVGAIHFGGGSPSMLAAEDIRQLRSTLDAHFLLEPSCEISLEVDPNDVTEAGLDAWTAFGVNRVSFGVQDFDETVQRAINRLQSFEQTKVALDGFRIRGVSSANLDVLYGLPHQTAATLARTIEQVIELSPDRIALFGYAHVPWMKKHQRLIDENALPDAAARLAQAQLGYEMLTAAGYISVGIDHFARPGDGLAAKAEANQVRRNFQGYTTDDAEVLIGLGASAIGRLPSGYIQNVVATADYSRAVLSGELATARGIKLTDDDRLRGKVIESLMCNFGFSLPDLRSSFGGPAEQIRDLADHVRQGDAEGFTEFDGERFVVTERGRPFVRSIAARFDAYYGGGNARHSLAV
jgi:oxygen-independent coproporphyrinogen-3 oxidase